MKRHIYIFRHGQTYFNKKRIFTGWKESNLTPLGIRQARIVAKKLKNKKIGLAFDNTLSRSRQTLREVLKYHPECKKVISDRRMIERDYGLLDGISHKEFIRKIGNQEYDLLRYGDAIENLSSIDRKKVEKFLGEEEYKVIHRGYDVAPPRGESFADVEKRVEEFIKDLMKTMKKRKINVAISASGNSIRLFRKIMEKASKEECVKWKIPYDKHYKYSIEI